mmetsp:Transcript_29855/g.71157  ORF Transcript_29855/g.71157 Transcript_29855/m.71157 type:complete len:101 (+) Transcript_29855:136-438(+)
MGSTRAPLGCGSQPGAPGGSGGGKLSGRTTCCDSHECPEWEGGRGGSVFTPSAIAWGGEKGRSRRRPRGPQSLRPLQRSELFPAAAEEAAPPALRALPSC